MAAVVTFSASVFAKSYPSAMTRGCRPSEMYLSACLRSSPIKSTHDVVPSPVMSSCAVAARAIMTAVGFWICISRSSTLPSLVSLIPPAPSTSLQSVNQRPHRAAFSSGRAHIFSVPEGPRLEASTYCISFSMPSLQFFELFCNVHLEDPLQQKCLLARPLLSSSRT